MFLFFLLIGTAFAARCDPGWTLFKDNCYKHIVNSPRLDAVQAVADCLAHDSYLAPAPSQEDRDFLMQLGSRPGNWNTKVDALKESSPDSKFFGGGTYFLDYLLLGAVRVRGERKYLWMKSNSTWFGNWCRYYEPSATVEESAIVLQFSPPCIWDVNFRNSYHVANAKFLHHICKKPAQAPPRALCTVEGTEVKSDGSCGCKKDYLDITDLQIPEGRGFKKGEKCIPRNPCQDLTKKGDLSIVFVVDSSQSIGASNWNNMVTFLKSGSRLLDNSVNIGFVKFSTDVSYNKWLPKRWSRDEYLDDVPSSFDAGYTNTPAALDAARELFQTRRGDHKVAVLITDGMPFVEEILPKETALMKTREAAQELRRDDIDLVALGYGEELRRYSSYLKDFLPNSNRDYFQYDGEACDFKEMHMSFLLNKVCQRFK